MNYKFNLKNLNEKFHNLIMQKNQTKTLPFNPSIFLSSNHKNHSKKYTNKFKKSSTAQYSTKTKKEKPQSPVQNFIIENPIGINSINNNIYLNLFNKFSTNPTLKQNMLSPKEIISNRINNNQSNKMRKNINLYEMPSSSSIKTKNKSTFIQPDLPDSLNVINNRGHINIRLNLKNQFINTHNNINDNNISESDKKMKEKNNKIIQLQNDLLKSQEIIHDLNNLNNTNNSFKLGQNNINKNLNKSSREKNIFMLTKSSESVDKILKTSFNVYNLKDINKKKPNKKNHKNNFLKKSGNVKNIQSMINNEKKIYKKNNIKINDILLTNYNQNKSKRKNDYLRLFLPMSNFYNSKPKFSSYSNDRKNIKNKISNNPDYRLNYTEKNKKQKFYINDLILNNKKKEGNNINIDEFKKKCENLKQRANNLINNYIALTDYLIKSKTK